MGTVWPGLLAVCRGTLQPSGMDPEDVQQTLPLPCSSPALPFQKLSAGTPAAWGGLSRAAFLAACA